MGWEGEGEREGRKTGGRDAKGFLTLLSTRPPQFPFTRPLLSPPPLPRLPSLNKSLNKQRTNTFSLISNVACQLPQKKKKKVYIYVDKKKMKKKFATRVSAQGAARRKKIRGEVRILRFFLPSHSRTRK